MLFFKKVLLEHKQKQSDQLVLDKFVTIPSLCTPVAWHPGFTSDYRWTTPHPHPQMHKKIFITDEVITGAAFAKYDPSSFRTE